MLQFPACQEQGPEGLEDTLAEEEKHIYSSL